MQQPAHVVSHRNSHTEDSPPPTLYFQQSLVKQGALFSTLERLNFSDQDVGQDQHRWVQAASGRRPRAVH